MAPVSVSSSRSGPVKKSPGGERPRPGRGRVHFYVLVKSLRPTWPAVPRSKPGS